MPALTAGAEAGVAVRRSAVPCSADAHRSHGHAIPHGVRLGLRIRLMTKPLTYTLALFLVVGTAVACGDDDDGAADGKGGSSGSSGSGGKGGKGGSSGVSGSSGSSGSAGTSGTGGRGGTAGQGGTSGTAGEGGAPDGGVGPGGAGGAGAEGGTGPEECNDVVNAAPPIPETQMTGTVPTPMGGTLVPGTYRMTGWEVYPPETADPTRMRSITGRFGADNTLDVVGAEGAQTQRFSGTWATASVVLTLTPTCPQVGMADVTAYTATSTTLRIVRVNQSRVEVFTRQ
jgi:hypothetical protein